MLRLSAGSRVHHNAAYAIATVTASYLTAQIQMHIVHYYYTHDEQRKERSTTHNCAQQCISNVY
jgi:hypothetical protein